MTKHVPEMETPDNEPLLQSDVPPPAAEIQAAADELFVAESGCSERILYCAALTGFFMTLRATGPGDDR